MKGCVVKPNERLKESRRGLKKAKRKLYSCNNKAWDDYLEECWMYYLDNRWRLND